MTLPLGPITSPILSIGISNETIFGALSATSDRGSAIAFVHHLEDREARLLRLAERLCEDVGGKAVDLRVELQGRHGLARPCDLEVHVAECVLGSEDVGEGDVAPVFVDESHRDPCDRGLYRDARVHERQGGSADRRHGGRPVRREDVRYETQRVGELLGRRDHGQKSTLCEQTVADLAALRARA